MVPFQIFLGVVLVSGVWCFSETLDDGVEIGEPMHFYPLQYKKVVFVCPAHYGRFPHEKDCSLFYECRMGHLQLIKCNRDKLYDAKRQQCNDKKRVNCHRNEKDKNDHGDDRDKNKVIKTFRCPSPSGTFAHPDDCSRYFLCFLNVPSMLQCYGSNLFDEKNRKCLHKRRVKCGKRLDRDHLTTTKIPTQRPTSRPKTTTTDKPTTKKDTRRYRCPFPRGRFADPEDCSKYYDCHSGVATVHECPRNKLYDERKEECSQDKNVKCGDRPGGVGGDKDEKDKIEIRCPYQWGIYPHPEDCSKYLICIYTVPTVYTCGKNELYHAKYRRCYPKDEVTCDYRINPDDLRQSTTKSGRTTIFITSTTKRTPSTKQPTSVTEITTFETTITTEAETYTPVPTTTVQTTTPVPKTTVETKITTEAETTPVPTTTEAETSPVLTTNEETTTTPEAETTPEETTTTPEAETTPEETTITTEAETTTPVPTTTEETTITTEAETTTPVPTTSEETTITTEAEATPEETTITTEAETTTETPESTTVKLTTSPSVPTTPPTTTKVTKPNTPPPTECEEDDLDCIIDGTGDVKGWFECPERFGHFAHASSHQLFIHCDNFKPYVKICADGTVFSPKYLVCMWLNQPGQKSF